MKKIIKWVLSKLRSVNWRRFFKEYNEWISFPLAVVLFFLVPELYRSVDKEAGGFDTGVMHLLVMSALSICFSSWLAWLMMKLNFPRLYKYWDDEAEEHIIRKPHLTYRAVLVSFGIYFIYFLTSVAIILLFMK